MYSSFRKELMAQVLEKDIVNIYYDNGKEIEKIVISKEDYTENYKPNQLKFKSLGFIIQKGPIRSVWYNYANIIKIEVFG